MGAVEVKRVDPQGRLVLPKSWRERWGNEVIVVELEDRIEILPRKKPRLSRFFDILEVELKGEDIEKELLKDINPQ
ncbi:predicted transcription regulator, SpoVT/AbrB family [Thermococcus kodakarensis KOD1]|uniref:Predicted transcription regulator, SpoVT/AbrB family n=1 Tax=Thermococcus kodakarensis (strain ATCC BAA-918 / JCM 12380 / KOD1) TaxID=69014 RepID=Q5JGQ2_THEKO|nr:AbrB/MazE/SpoVT family DNA-binding domain-containing protein [Thermococcus kodakarensis]WCN27282.1 AbrB/MazE/SpoVT family DNA-binding domain-containing protein [Thermococcus kodakarensis]WCN29569.1 AbrB/MazE/SpoVT family DNA-binding domain-containing protein [Thermococcus kodakarensis]BAD85480.1 predicted transcription regulator, SpoVT/AbrB family [Thermococcus kodakarensis KOD1]